MTAVNTQSSAPTTNPAEKPIAIDPLASCAETRPNSSRRAPSRSDDDGHADAV